jgi:hypothetical protein
MKIKNKKSFVFGVIILLILICSYFIKINLENGLNYYVEDSLLGIIIFHNVFFLLAYILLGIFLIFRGLSK